MTTDPAVWAPGAPAIAHCPSCRGAVRPGAPWCTQCWADLRPPPAPEPAPQPRVQPRVGPRAEVRAAPVEPVEPAEPAELPAGRLAGWPCAACGHVNAVELDVCAGCGTGFLAAMRAGQAPLLELPGVGDITRLSRAQRLGLAGGVALAFVLLVLLAGVLLG